MTIEYVELDLEGDIANAIPPWGQRIVGAHVHTEIRNPDAIPYVATSTDALVAEILSKDWLGPPAWVNRAATSRREPAPQARTPRMLPLARPTTSEPRAARVA